MSSKLKKAIGAVKDQTSISLAKVSSSGGGCNALEVSVLKATSHDPSVPLDCKHALEIVRLVSSSKSHAAAAARVLGKRIGRTRNWVVALKSLILILRIFQDGDPYFPREVLHAMKRGARILNLSSFRDDSSSSSPWDFTSFVRTFALYLDERLDCFLTGKLQRRSSNHHHDHHRSKNREPNEPVRDMKPAMLLDRMSHWQRLLDRAIATRPTGAARADPLVRAALHAIVRESFDLYRDVSDGLSLVLDSFFHLQYQNCVAAFHACVKAVRQFPELAAFYSLCKSLDVGRSSEYPSVQVVSDELVETLGEFLKDQSSFSAGPAAAAVAPPFPRPPPQPERGSSLEELISATETTAGLVGPVISIDLETYPTEAAANDGDAFGPSDTGSSRSLPATSSIVDLMSLEDWAEEPNNWEVVLAETMSTPTSSSAVSMSREEMPNDHYVNPFLVDHHDPFEPTAQGVAVPTFQARITGGDDPFGEKKGGDDPFGEFTGETMFGGAMDLQKLKQQQEMWLQNQNKIIAKNWS
ncbi:Clathrin coat assembly protein AP180 [Striga hermonthica]|uniref:Clathrin coat assembly protein AP180 n=1 Tax=Striga hermonthica TaxID=68872 RepID=A0A9N7R6N2_STRHE|nr:Clathrin coat assembly protein AP180 [Striga hermonthica]